MENTRKYNVAVVDDHKIFREGFKLVLQSVDSVGSIDEAENGEELLELIKNKSIDLVFMDVSMPVMDGIEATKKATQIQPDTKIVALTYHSDDEYINNMIYAGVEGYLLKDAEYEEVENAIENIMAGKNYFSEKILMKLTRNTMKSKEEEKRKAELPKLSKRELEVLKLVCKGLSKTDIANKLFISERTVEKHKENLMTKTGTKNTVNLVIFALKHNLAKL